MAKTKIELQGPEVTPALGEPFTFSSKTEAKIKRILKRYPQGKSRSAVIPVLKLAQDDNEGWVSTSAMEAVAERLSLPYMRVYEIATFYTMFNLKPVGKYHLQVCTNCSCLISGSDAVVGAVKEFTGVSENGETSVDGLFTFSEVECLGACVEGPLIQVNSGYHTKLNRDKTLHLLTQLKNGDAVESVTPTAPMKEGY